MAYGYQNLRLSGYDVESIYSCKVEASMGQHTKLSLKAILKEEGKDKAIHTTTTNHPVEVYIEAAGEKTSLFHGIVTKIEISYQAEVYYLEIEAKSYTYLMDITKHSRSFQNINMTYHEVIENIIRSYPEVDCIINIPNKPIGELLVQYEETDWEFIKRISAAFNEGVFPAVEKSGVCFYIGVSDIYANNMVINNINLKKELDTYYRIKANSQKEIIEKAYSVYKIEASQIAYLMHCIKLNGHDFYIKKLKYEMQNSLLVNYYEVQLKQGLSEETMYPMHLIGVALGGKILVPQGDKVKVHLDIDKKQDKSTAYWFPYSTMSASTDGSGWYCMPEIGDTVRVYFPTKYTKDAVALSSVSIYDTPTSGEDRMSSPDVKYLRTVHDKEMKLAPEGIRIACNGSTAVLSVGQEGKISLYGNKSIKVEAEENIVVKATKDISLTALETIELACDKGGKFLLDQAGNIVIQGTEVKVD